MKTTIEISTPLLRRAKRLAARRRTTLRAVIEDALRHVLAAEQRAQKARPVKTHVVGGEGLQPGLTWGDWSALRALAYEGRGS